LHSFKKEKFTRKEIGYFQKKNVVFFIVVTRDLFSGREGD
jgi:hypothetical protein